MQKYGKIIFGEEKSLMWLSLMLKKKISRCNEITYTLDKIIENYDMKVAEECEEYKYE